MSISLVAFRGDLYREANELHPPLLPPQCLHPFLGSDVVEVTAGNAQVGVPELLLDEVQRKPLLRTGTAAVPQPPWPDSGYPKIAEGEEIASAFCVPETNTHIPIDAYGLSGPRAVLVPVETYVDFSP